ncbi:hypothetical protein K3G63_10900 [Hymenobacter sp. HSC-4F20]|uniref:hypothetical protein n=1 Tax=Hymenobacter sp. HSC-4F20 TaxID=2864135 RepID=UPI001C72BD9A|nr:hypothetical protein [Hymenobacter sp. HSC-4F20]MBX0290950.1 hypothetical protein [Hymenobacter sp. HSC-4F20]
MGAILLGAYGVYLVAKEPVKNFLQSYLDSILKRQQEARKQPSVHLVPNSRKAIILEQTAERLRLESGCDHVSLYAVQNGEYLRTGDSVEKFVMQAEAARPGDARYMDTERILFAQDVPRLILVLEQQAYALLWHNRCDDWKSNKIMAERDYQSAIAVFVRRPGGVIGLYVLNWRETELVRPDQTPDPQVPTRPLDAALEQLLKEYASEFSYLMSA